VGNRSLRRAAESLHIQQSTLSRGLREMEARLGTQLFERTNGGTHPTSAGREFLVSAQRILAETDAAMHRLRTRARGESGRLTIGIYASPSTGNMFATLVEHCGGFPDVEVLTVDGSHNQLLCALANGAVDIAVMTASRSAWDGRVLPLWTERVILAVHADHRLSKREMVGWSDLEDETILIPQHGPGPNSSDCLSHGSTIRRLNASCARKRDWIAC
jgi:DNA-binding transcriptional LysR family regulator